VFFCMSVSYTKSLWTWYLTNRLWEFHHIYILGAIGDDGEQVNFEVKRLKVKTKTRYFQINSLEGLSYKPLMEISSTLQLVCSWAQRWTDWIWGQKVKGQGHGEQGHDETSHGQNHLLTNAPYQQRHNVRWFAVEDHPVMYIFIYLFYYENHTKVHKDNNYVTCNEFLLISTWSYQKFQLSEFFIH